MNNHFPSAGIIKLFPPNESIVSYIPPLGRECHKHFFTVYSRIKTITAIYRQHVTAYKVLLPNGQCPCTHKPSAASASVPTGYVFRPRFYEHNFSLHNPPPATGQYQYAPCGFRWGGGRGRISPCPLPSAFLTHHTTDSIKFYQGLVETSCFWLQGCSGRENFGSVSPRKTLNAEP
jgi:hypothetical protein